MRSRCRGPIFSDIMTSRSRFPGVVRVVQHQSDHQFGRLPACPARQGAPRRRLVRGVAFRPGEQIDRSTACDEPCVDLAWVSPRSWSSETHPAHAAGALPSAPDTSDARADSVARSTRPRGAVRISAQATRSNIQSGTSCHRPRAAPSREHRARAVPAFSTTSRIRTGRPLHGCHR